MFDARIFHACWPEIASQSVHLAPGTVVAEVSEALQMSK